MFVQDLGNIKISQVILTQLFLHAEGDVSILGRTGLESCLTQTIIELGDKQVHARLLPSSHSWDWWRAFA
jgi:hypothetical protein